MKIIEKYKYYLNTKKKKPSKITTKNYLSDIKKFIKWFEDTQKISFNPKITTFEIISTYQLYLVNEKTPSSCIDRYMSSLRGFFQFLKQENLINTYPFITKTEIKELHKDPLMLDQFKIYLLSHKLSRVTIKNYIMDTKQFFSWLEKINTPHARSSLFEKINELIIDEYKERLLSQAHLSPVSINRKLSSLRKYINWRGEKNIKLKRLTPEKNIKTTGLNTINKITIFKEIEDQNNQKKYVNKNISRPIYSFNPIKIPINIITLISDLLITIPIIKLLDISYRLTWKIKRKSAFAPTQEILKNSLNPTNHSKYIEEIQKISKPIYSHTQISIKPVSKPKKLYFHLRHTRPQWYKEYHSHTISHYLHITILIIFTAFTMSTLYTNLYKNLYSQNKAFASPPLPPPKILAFQGKLSDSYNNPITEATPLRLAIYNNKSASGSALIWQEVQIVKPDSEGIFQTQIGQTNPISASIFSNNPALYLGITIGNDQELQPRQELATISYSSNSQQLQGMIPITENNAGTSNVILALDSAGNLIIGGKASPIFEASGGKFTISGKTLLLTSTTGSNGNIEIAPDGNGIIDLQKPLQNTTNNNNINSSQGAVEINDLFAILATSSGQSALAINQDSTGPIISASSSGNAKFTLENNGTGIFAGNLFVNGDNLISTNTSFNLLNTNTVNLNIANSATAISIGSNTGTTSINNTLMTNSLIVSGYASSDIAPSIDRAYNLGSSSNHWNNAYINNLFTSPNATTSGFWQKNKGSISLLNPDDNLVIGGTSTESAKFQIFTSGTASTSGELTFKNNSKINLLNNANLGFYNSVAGDSGINTTKPALYIASNGKIGIGTNTPAAYSLDVSGNVRASSGFTGNCLNNPVFTNNGNCNQDIAEIYNSSEPVESGDIVSIDTTTGNGTVKKSSLAYDQQAIGIVTTRPGIILGINGSDVQIGGDTTTYMQHADPLKPAIALNGKVPVKVSTENGVIQAGDFMTTSSKPGIAMKATKPGMTIGKALDNYANPNPDETGQIQIFINLSFYEPNTATGSSQKYNLSDNINTVIGHTEALTNTIFPKIKAVFIQAQKISTDSLELTTENITIGSQTLKEYITKIVQDAVREQLANPPRLSASDQRLATNGQNPTALLSPLASESAVAFTPPNIPSVTNPASPSATYITNITNIYNTPPASNSALENNPSSSTSADPQFTTPSTNLANTPTATESAIALNANNSQLSILNSQFSTLNSQLDLASLSGTLAYIPNLSSSSPLFTHGIIAGGYSTLSDVTIAGELNIGGNFILGNNSINTIGSNLELQPLRQGDLSIMGDLINIDTNGNLKVNGNASFAKNVAVKGKLAANVIAPIPGSDIVLELENNNQEKIHESSFVIHDSKGSNIININQFGDLIASGSGKFANINIIRGAQADTSLVQTEASSSAGTAVITANEIERTIISPFITKNSLIYLTAASNTQGLTPYIARQTEKDFTIAIPYAINKDIKINWWIVN